MLELSRTYLIDLFKSHPEALKKLGKLKADYVCVDFITKQALKSREQNNLFHSLLECFWKSGCSSFNDYDELRTYYKRVAGLVKPAGKYLKEQSWADATKENAKTAIDMCIRDMDFAGVIGSSEGLKYQEILKGIKKFWEGK